MTFRAFAGGLALAALLGGCGVAGSGDVQPGYPTSNPTFEHKPYLTPTWQGTPFVITVPRGWEVARLDQGNPYWSIVRNTGSCYLSISVTGSATRPRNAGAIVPQYAKPADGYDWVVRQFGRRVIAVLDQYGSGGRPPLRSTLGDAYIPSPDGPYVIVDIGAGIWPLRHHSCTATQFVRHVPELQAGILRVFAGASEEPPEGAIGH